MTFDDKIANLIFEKWSADLQKKDRSKKAYFANFDELFEGLKKSGATLDTAYHVLPYAIKTHSPPKIMRKKTWEKVKGYIGVTETEFYEEWINSIKAAATEAMFTHFPLKVEDEEDQAPKVYGNMSVREYRLQRKYADAFPTLNTDQLEQELRERRSEIDLDTQNVLGGSQDDLSK